MGNEAQFRKLFDTYVTRESHQDSDYFGLVKELIVKRKGGEEGVDVYMTKAYELIGDELATNQESPRATISFGTSGWRGILGKDVFVHSVRCVTSAIVKLYASLEENSSLSQDLGVSRIEEAQKRGCLVAHDNRFGGAELATAVTDVLTDYGFKVYYCGESTTGVLSAALLELGCAFSVNLTPSHNPLEYGGVKFNGADAGPASADVTALITTYAREAVSGDPLEMTVIPEAKGEVIELDSFRLWQDLVIKNGSIHGIDYETLLQDIGGCEDVAVVIDSVHGASRLHIDRLLGPAANHLELLRGEPDVTFGGIAPEPSSENMRDVTRKLAESTKRLKIGAIIDPDADRIRFTDGETEVSMNQFGAMAYHYLHEYKGKKGMVAKTVATSNFANAIARQLGEEVFETRVGFKEFKPVIGEALVYFEESDGISIIGHTPEKDAYIGLLVALDMVYNSDMNLGDYQRTLEAEFGVYCPDRDGIEVYLQGGDLKQALNRLAIYGVGSEILVGDERLKIKEVLTLDGRKMIFEDDSWLMIRPSGTEPKVRFYVESRSPEGTGKLVEAARRLLAEIGLVSSPNNASEPC